MYKLFLALFFPCILPGHLKLAFKSHLLLKEKKKLRGTPETKEISLIFIFSVYCCVTTRPYFHFSELPTRPSTEKFEKPREKDNSKFLSVYIRGIFFPV